MWKREHRHLQSASHHTLTRDSFKNAGYWKYQITLKQKMLPPDVLNVLVGRRYSFAFLSFYFTVRIQVGIKYCNRIGTVFEACFCEFMCRWDVNSIWTFMGFEMLSLIGQSVLAGQPQLNGMLSICKYRCGKASLANARSTHLLCMRATLRRISEFNLNGKLIHHNQPKQIKWNEVFVCASTAVVYIWKWDVFVSLFSR